MMDGSRKTFTEPLLSLEEFDRIAAKCRDPRGSILITGCIDTQKANLAYALSVVTGRRAVVITENDLKAKQFFEDLRFYSPNAALYPAIDLLFYQADVHSGVLEEQRVSSLRTIEEDPDAPLVLPVPALLDRITEKEDFRDAVLTVRKDEDVDYALLQEKLGRIGYERCAQVTLPGQFSVRGDILDVYSMTQDMPFRIGLFGDTVESIRYFDTETQLSVEEAEEAVIYPGEMRGGTKGSLLSYFDPARTLFILDEVVRIRESAQATEDEFRESVESRIEQGMIDLSDLPEIFSTEEIMERLEKLPGAALCAIDPPSDAWKKTERFGIHAQGVSGYNGSFEFLIRDLRRYVRAGYRAAVLVASRTRAARIAADLHENGLTAFFSEETDRVLGKGEILVTPGHARQGFEYPLSRFVLITEEDIFGKRVRRRKPKKKYDGKRITDFSELAVGDYVVHESHGLGIYRGTQKIESAGVLRDYIKVEYDGSNLYVLATQLDTLQKYAGADAKKPKLNKLGGQEWRRTKSRVRHAVGEIAKELVALYASRQGPRGFVYGKDTVWQSEFEELFPYEETEDQITAIEDTKRDMETDRIMDRLICGDVGYGKTEVALRAAFKAVQDGKQVAFLVPTTILAQQHYNTFTQRMKDFPVRVDLLSRFRTKTEQDKTVRDLKAGKVDIVIGTHRLLSKDVQYKDLGLLVIDEEQRFGVTHKEKIKQLRTKVDVLTLTATPIPRTLHMSLIGIRDMSVLEEAPQDRMPIQTYVCEYNREMVREAICRELARDGQVYYVYNRVSDIADVARRVQEMVPEASVAYADGQMKEAELERVMVDFINHEIDVIVTTTIIETGLDIPNVNTIIIHDADRYGLAQLYQLRGRVGRSNRTAYAFLMYRRDKVLREVAEKRLSAIREFTELGSGIKIAMRDLEIRGAGNLLGREQHGNMDAVGYDLYCKMLASAVAKEKGEATVEEEFETLVDLPVDAYIPEGYISDEFQKIDAYKKIAGIVSEEDLAAVSDELTDRYGELPEPVKSLISVSFLRASAHRASLTEMKIKDGVVEMAILEKPAFDPLRLPDLLTFFDGKIRFRRYRTGAYFLYDVPDSKKEMLAVLTEFCVSLARI